jgi:curved DNA-binding protein CbpA
VTAIVPHLRNAGDATQVDAVERFVISLIDGTRDAKAIGEEAGLELAQIEAVLIRLKTRGIVDWTTAAEDEVELDDSQKSTVLALFARVGQASHYELLGVPRDADKKAVKKAYYAVAMAVHPDRFFRKKLGSFKGKMEVIFTRLTEAHDVLSDATRRAEYDQYIGNTQQARAIEEMIARTAEAFARAEAEVRREAEAAAEAAAVASMPPPAPAVTRPSGTMPAPITARAPTAISVDDKARREALAKRLLGNRPGGSIRPPGMTAPPPSAPASSIPERPKMTTEEAAAILRKRYEERFVQAKEGQLKKQLKIADDAEDRNDFEAAYTALRVANQMVPEDRNVAARLAVAHQRAAEQLTQVYREKAIYEATAQHWDESAKSWRKLAELNPNNWEALERAADAIVRAKGNLHLAAELAKRAVDLQPANAQVYVTLGTVYLEAGQRTGARAILERARALAPTSPVVASLFSSVQKLFGSEAKPPPEG